MSDSLFLEQAIALYQKGNLRAALEAYQQAVQAEPNNPFAWDGMGIAMRASGDLKGALEAGTKATEYGPNEAQVWSNLGNTQAALGDDTAALRNYIRATTLAPTFADAWANRGMSEKRLKQTLDAANSLTRAADLMVNSPQALNSIGNQLFDLFKFEKARDCYKNAVDADPGFVNAWNNLGNTELQLLHPNHAQMAYKQALSIEPSHKEARNGYAQALLMAGDFKQGWSAYEARLEAPSAPQIPSQTTRKWTGQSLTGKSLLLLAEQGLGDTIQFLRFARHLKPAAAQVTLECPASLADLASTASGIDQTVVSADHIAADFYVALMSLPYVLGLNTVEDLATKEPYLKISPSRHRRSDRPQIGLVWSGNPDHVNDHNRSMEFSELVPLLENHPFDFHSFQQGLFSLQASEGHGPVQLHHVSRRFESFAQTATALADIDLLITVDTSIAHLAGAMGCPCWLLVPYVADWRWMLATDKTPWYPSLRLFRQSVRGDWSTVIRDVARALPHHF